jgi:hypothetical protein
MLMPLYKVGILNFSFDTKFKIDGQILLPPQICLKRNRREKEFFSSCFTQKAEVPQKAGLGAWGKIRLLCPRKAFTPLIKGRGGRARPRDNSFLKILLGEAFIKIDFCACLNSLELFQKLANLAPFENSTTRGF